jgi:ferredoxin--NADP+ reductase
LAPAPGWRRFLSIVRDPATYEKFEKVILVHGVRQVAELAYHDYLTRSCRTTSFWARW